VIDWTSGVLEASPIGVGIAVGVVVVASLAFVVWKSISGSGP
jgi:hypothetical protein